MWWWWGAIYDFALLCMSFPVCVFVHVHTLSECEASPINTVMAHHNFNHSMFPPKLITVESKCPFYTGELIYCKLLY